MDPSALIRAEHANQLKMISDRLSVKLIIMNYIFLLLFFNKISSNSSVKANNSRYRSVVNPFESKLTKRKLNFKNLKLKSSKYIYKQIIYLYPSVLINLILSYLLYFIEKHIYIFFVTINISFQNFLS